MPTKPVKKESSTIETLRPVRKAAPRVSTAKHRTPKTQESPATETAIEIGVDAREMIAAIAYGYWEERGYQGGDPTADWVRAEQEFYGSKALAVSA